MLTITNHCDYLCFEISNDLHQSLPYLFASILPCGPTVALTASEPALLLLAILLKACNEVQDKVELLLPCEQAEPCREP